MLRHLTPRGKQKSTPCLNSRRITLLPLSHSYEPTPDPPHARSFPLVRGRSTAAPPRYVRPSRSSPCNFMALIQAQRKQAWGSRKVQDMTYRATNIKIVVIIKDQGFDSLHKRTGRTMTTRAPSCVHYYIYYQDQRYGSFHSPPLTRKSAFLLSRFPTLQDAPRSKKDPQDDADIIRGVNFRS